jgi:hypothetical protein
MGEFPPKEGAKVKTVGVPCLGGHVGIQGKPKFFRGHLRISKIEVGCEL